jgi:molybdopterin synthase catalytic subunit
VIEITRDPLDPEAITAKVRRDTNGAVVTFLGTTRSFTGSRNVLHLEYEAYRPMADKKLAEIAVEMRQRWPVVEDVALAHRLGRLEISDISLVVAVASPHRKDAFAACQYAVDRIKQMVPIWKKEYFEGGEVWVGSQEDVHAEEPVEASGG